MKMLMSIHPEHVAKILSGEKKFEYRRIAAKQDVDSLIIYETTPVQRVVAEVKIIEVIELPPEELWEETCTQSGISKAFFDEYFKGRSIGYAYRLGEVIAYDSPRELSFYGIKAAPQSFVYLYA